MGQDPERGQDMGGRGRERGQMNGLALEKNKMILSEVRAGDKMDKDVPVGRDER